MALIVVLWISAILTLLMYSFLSGMQVEYALAGGYGDEKKAEQLAWSAIDLGCATADTDVRDFHALWDPWSHDELRFYEAPMGDGAFTLLHLTYQEDRRRLWGMDDEASKINLNVVPREVLMKLPRMTAEVADSIIDWRDEDTNAGPSGAEDSHYLSLNPPYRCKNQPFETVEELALVRGMTPEILYGEDTNLNGRLDPNENDGDDSYPPDDRNGKLDPGLWAFATVWSFDRNEAADGAPRVNINAAPVQDLIDAGLNPAEAQAIQVQRTLLGSFTSTAQLLGNPAGGGGAILSPDRFRQLADVLTIFDGNRVPGLVNVNTAPKPVLLCLPGMTSALADEIIAHRAVEGSDLSSVAWLLDVAPPAEFQPFAGALTVRSYQFRMHAVGRVGTPYSPETASDPSERPRAFKRMIAVYDLTTMPRARLVYWKDLTRLGMPYDPSEGPEELNP
jgi:type II secretory pathway component PulK